MYSLNERTRKEKAQHPDIYKSILTNGFLIYLHNSLNSVMIKLSKLKNFSNYIEVSR